MNFDKIYLYIYGCQTCGVNSVHVRRLRAACFNTGASLVVKNTKYDKDALTEHVGYLTDSGMELDNYQPIVVEGDKVTVLREWL